MPRYKYRLKTNQTEKKAAPFIWRVGGKNYGPEKDERYYDIPKMFQPRVDWLKDHTDKIIKFENLKEGFSDPARSLKIDIELPHLNRTTSETT